MTDDEHHTRDEVTMTTTDAHHENDTMPYRDAPKLTPYDTGERCDARPWLPYGTSVSQITPAENFGKVDFDDECGDTVATTWTERLSDGSYRLIVENHIEPGELSLDVRQGQ